MTAVLPILILCVILQFAFCVRLASANPAPEKNEAVCFVVKQAEMVTSETGWVILQRSPGLSSDASGYTESRVYWTSDNGQHWGDITPPADRVPIFVSVFFLDSDHGWIVGMDSELSDPPPHYYVFSTRDGGQNWSKAELNSNLMDSPGFPMNPAGLVFIDPQHGWMSWHWAMMNSRVSAMAATQDGGKTWKQLPPPPSSGPMQFLSPSDGWIIGGSEGQEGIPVVEDDALWVTHNGGVKWEPVSVPLPAGSSATGAHFLAARFKNKREGRVAAVLYSSESEPNNRYFEFVTRDAGRSWRSIEFTGSNSYAVIGGDFLYWSEFQSSSRKQQLRTTTTLIDSTLPLGLSPEGGFGVFGFHDKLRGWATFKNGPSAYSTTRGRAYAEVELLSTSDGGRTWQIITPSAAAQEAFPPPELMSVNGMIVRFPSLPPDLAIRYPRVMPSYGLTALDRTTPGGSMELKGRGFLPENTVRIGEESVDAESKDGTTLVFTLPEKLTPGNYQLSVENAHGKTDPSQIAVGSPQCLQITKVQDLSVRCGCRPVIHPGQKIRIEGMGFRPGDTVKFGSEAIVPKLILQNGVSLEVEVPESLAKGPSQIYVLRQTQASNVVGVEVQ